MQGHFPIGLKIRAVGKIKALSLLFIILHGNENYTPYLVYLLALIFQQWANFTLKLVILVRYYKILFKRDYPPIVSHSRGDT